MKGFYRFAFTRLFWVFYLEKIRCFEMCLKAAADEVVVAVTHWCLSEK